MGTPDFAMPALEAVAEDHTIKAVYTKEPKVAGRGHHLRKSPVHLWAEENDVPVYTPKSFKKYPEEIEKFKDLCSDVDMAIVCAYGLILPSGVLDAPKHGCINIHGSLLPRWRGAAPIQRALMAGDKKTGITIMQMDEGLDTGDMLLKQEVAITPEMNVGELHDEMAKVGAFLITQYLDNMDNIEGEKQDDSLATYAHKINKEDCKVLWEKHSGELCCQIRGLCPFPKSYFYHNENRIKIIKAEVIDFGNFASNKKVGEVLDDQLTVVCGNGTIIRLLEVQKEGGKPMKVTDFLNGYKIEPGEVLE